MSEKYPCAFDYCQKSFTAKKSLLEHVRIHKGEKPYVCKEETCLKRFTQYSSFQKHLRIHKGEKPYKCNEDNCNHSFTQISNLNRHKRIHTKEKPFLCEKCLKSFTTTSNLKQHIQTHSLTEKREKFNCKNCEKSYFYPSSLRKHTQYHKSDTEKSPSLRQRQKPGTTGLPSVLHHKDHIDMLINAGELIAHELEESELNPIRCLPLEDKLHSTSFTNLGLLYFSKLNELKSKNQGKLLLKNESQENLEKNHSEFCFSENRSRESDEAQAFWEKEEEPGLLEKESLVLPKNSESQNLEEIVTLMTSKKDNPTGNLSVLNAHLSEFYLLNQSRQEPERHMHGPGCGHSIINHQGHIDYIVEGTLHFPHNEHCDDHGRVVFA